MKKTLKFLIIGVVLVGLVAGYYYYISNKPKATDEEEVTTKVTKVQELLLRNVKSDYPPTPKEVVKFYADITTAFYTEEYTDEEFTGLAMKIRELYDDELLSANTEEEYLMRLRQEVMTMKEKGMVVSSYATSASTDVDFFTRDGFSFARLNLAFTLKSGKNIGITKETFLLRKDDEGHWKIYGWVLTKDE